MAMLSLRFLIFSFLAVGLSYLSDNLNYRKIVLLLSGVFFYYSFSSINLLYLLALVMVSYFAGKRICIGRSRLLLAAMILLLIAYLSMFKYTSLLMPVGISFYIFKMISYLVDAYRGKNEEISLSDYAVYIMYFPLISMGPINRASNFVSKLKCSDGFSYQEVHDGFMLFFFGFLEKIVITNRLHLIVADIYGNYQNYDSIYLLIVVLLYTFEIYTDFDSYSNMAIGLSRMFGIRIEKNFNVPYMSRNIREFWRRWHISLSTWLRDYIYIPLGGNRKGEFRKYLNIMIVFFISGIWHGNNLNFLIWGLLNGLAQIINIIYSKLVSPRFKSSVFTRTAALAVTFVTVNLLWVFFRAGSAEEAVLIIRSIFTVRDLHFTYMLTAVSERNFIMTMAFLGIFVITDAVRYRFSLVSLVGKMPLMLRWGLYLLMVTVIVIFGVYGIDYNASDFIYNQF